METKHIGFGEALSMLIILTLSHLILTLPKSLLESQGSGIILNIVYISFLAFCIVFILSKLYKNFYGKDILDISEFLFGKVFKFIVGVTFILYFLFVASLLIRSSSENLKTMYFQNTSIPFLAFFILACASFINKLGSNVVIKCNLIIVPLIVMLLTILFLLSSNNFNTHRFFPVLGYGAKNIFLNGATNLHAFGCIVYLLFIMPFLKSYNQFNKISYLGIGLSALFIMLTSIALLLMFPLSIASGSNVPIYMQTRELTIGNLVQRADAFFVIIWILTLLSYLSIIINFIIIIFRKITNIQFRFSIVNCFLAILFGISLLYNNIIQVKYFQANVYKNFFLILVLRCKLFNYNTC